MTNTPNNVPISLYYLAKRFSENIDPRIVIEECAAKYPEFDKVNDFKKISRILTLSDKDDLSSHNREKVMAEKRIFDHQVEAGNLKVDTTTPLTDEEKDIFQRAINAGSQTHIFSQYGRLSKRNYQQKLRADPGTVSSEELEILRDIKPADPELDYLDDIGKHLYIHHGWHLPDFQEHPTRADRMLADDLIHSPMLGVVDPGGTTAFDKPEDGTIHEGAKIYRKVPVLSTVTPSKIMDHMMLLHGKPGNIDDHKQDHINGVSNHTHYFG